MASNAFRPGCSQTTTRCAQSSISFGAKWHRDDLGVVTTVIDVPHPPDPPFSPELTKQIHDVTAQVVRVVG